MFSFECDSVHFVLKTIKISYVWWTSLSGQNVGSYVFMLSYRVWKLFKIAVNIWGALH